MINSLFKKAFATGTLLFSMNVAAAPDFWIDVRSPEEFQSGHVGMAINIPVEQIAERIKEVTTDKNAEIYLSCRSGRRSGMALDTLKAMGYTKVANVGGIEDALKLEKELEKELDK
jgi:phage shock protein E